VNIDQVKDLLKRGFKGIWTKSRKRGRERFGVFVCTIKSGEILVNGGLIGEIEGV